MSDRNIGLEARQHPALLLTDADGREVVSFVRDGVQHVVPTSEMTGRELARMVARLGWPINARLRVVHGARRTVRGVPR